jgi:4-hydroxy-tetrahydrodipicolinate reductase
MMGLRVCVAGATGWVGQPLCHALHGSDDLTLSGAVSRTHRGENLGELLGLSGVNVIISGTVAEALATPTDVLIDYTSPDAVKGNVLTAVARGVHVVIGKSGLSEQDFAEIERAALDHQVGVVAAGNFATTAMLLQRFACEAAAVLSHWGDCRVRISQEGRCPKRHYARACTLAFAGEAARKPPVGGSNHRRQGN